MLDYLFPAFDNKLLQLKHTTLVGYALYQIILLILSISAFIYTGKSVSLILPLSPCLVLHLVPIILARRNYKLITTIYILLVFISSISVIFIINSGNSQISMAILAMLLFLLSSLTLLTLNLKFGIVLFLLSVFAIGFDAWLEHNGLLNYFRMEILSNEIFIFFFTCIASGYILISLVYALTNERLQKEKDLEVFKNQEYSTRLNHIAESVPGMIYQYQIHPDGTQNFPYVSKRMKEFYGVSPEEANKDASKAFEWIYYEDLGLLHKSIEESAKDLSTWKLLHRVKKPDGTIHWYDGIAFPERLADGSVFWNGHVQEITERIYAERAIKESEKKFRTVVTNLPAVVFKLDKNGIFTLSEGMGLQVLNLSPGQVVGASALEMYSSFPEVKASLEKALQGEFVVSETLVGEITFANRFTPLLDSNGNVDGVLGVSIDISKRRKAEEEIRLSQAKLHAILNNMPYLAWLKDTKGHFILVNQPFAKACGHAIDQIIGLTDCEIWPLDLAEKYQADDQEVIVTKRSKKVEEPISEINETKWFETFKTPIFDKKNEVIGTTGLAADITERKLAEEALRNSEERLKSIVDASFEGIGFSSNGFIIDSNQQLSSLFGYNPDEMIGKKVIDFVAPESYELVMTYIKTNSPGPFEHIAIRKDGTKFPVEVRARMIESGNSKIRISAIRDITLQKQREEQINQLNNELENRVTERTSQLESANKELESFAYSVSHDLRAPLRHIDGFLKLLYSNIPAHSEKITDYYHKINSATKRMTNMIDDLLLFSRLGRKELVRQSVNLESIVNEVIEQLTPDMANRQIEWKRMNLPVVTGDKNLLKLVFENLISNALKYTSKNEIAKIEIGYIQIQNNFIEIFIKDNGVGFDMTYVNKLFGVFQRLHSNEEFEGTGIGLANVKQIINKHKGSVRAEGKPNEGATIYIILSKQ